MRKKSKWSPGPGIKVQGITLQDEENWVVYGEAKPVGLCPNCGAKSHHRHGQRKRQLADLAIQGRAVKVIVSITRWQYKDRRCGRRTFSDQLPSVAPPYVRRTSRMPEIVSLVGHGMGGRPAESLLHRLGMPVSDNTILRLLKRNAPCSIDNTEFVLSVLMTGAGGSLRTTVPLWSTLSDNRSSMFWTT